MASRPKGKAAAKFERISVNLTPEQKAKLDERIAELPVPYRSYSDYFIALWLYDMICRRPHKVTAKVFASPGLSRDKAIAAILADFAAGKKNGKVTWFDKRLRELMENGELDDERPLNP